MKANLKILEGAASDQDYVSKVMLGLAEDLEEINKVLDGCFKPNYFKSNIQWCRGAVLDSQRKITQCANALNNVVHTYSGTENRIVDSFDSGPIKRIPIEVGIQNIELGKKMIESIFK